MFDGWRVMKNREFVLENNTHKFPCSPWAPSMAWRGPLCICEEEQSVHWSESEDQKLEIFEYKEHQAETVSSADY